MPIEVSFSGKKKVNAEIEGFTIETDQPFQSGGENSAPTPFTLFLASLATCAGIYVKGFCDQRGLDSRSLHVSMDYQYDPALKMVVKFIIRIHVPLDFPSQYESAVIKTASLCTVKRHLHPSIENEITIVRS